MARCPKCFYELTLLEKKRRYKCAKCSGLFLQKEIELKEFHKFNGKERKILNDQAKKERKEEIKVDRKRYVEANRDKMNAYQRKYTAKMREEYKKMFKHREDKGKT